MNTSISSENFAREYQWCNYAMKFVILPFMHNNNGDQAFDKDKYSLGCSQRHRRKNWGGKS